MTELNKFPLNVDKSFIISTQPEKYQVFCTRLKKWVNDFIYVPGNLNLFDIPKSLIRIHSHQRMWREIVRQKYKTTFICEEDAEIFNNDETNAYIAKINNEISGLYFDILICSYKDSHISRTKFSDYIFLNNNSTELYSYVITLSGAKKLLKTIKHPLKLSLIDTLKNNLKVMWLQPKL